MRRSILLVFLLALAIFSVACSREQKSEPQTPPNAAPTSAGQPQSAGQPPQSDGQPPQSTGTPQLTPRPPAEKSAAEVPPKILTVPAGTEITVRLTQAVGSRISQAGDSFQATVVRPIRVSGEVVVPQGAEAAGHVAEAAPLGRFKGGAKLQLTLDSVTIRGKKYPALASVSRVSQGKGKRTAGMVGGGAGLGAVIGAIAGGGKGAAIGALAGAGAGTAGTAFTGNKEIVLPAESELTFKIQQAMEVK